MKKCPRCKVVFKDDAQFHCLYCEGSLMSAHDVDFVEDEQASSGMAKAMASAKELTFNEKLTHDRKDYLMGTFFRGSTFLSSFRFNLNDLKKGKEYKRFLIRPMDISSVIKIPWIFVNVIYSAFFYLLPKKYCPTCGWKYISSHGETKHDKDECLYNQEYNLIEEEVFSGKVFVDLDPIRQISDARIKQGKPSALRDLLKRNLRWEKSLDLVAILASIIIYVYILTLLAMPILDNIYQFDVV